MPLLEVKCFLIHRSRHRLLRELRILHLPVHGVSRVPPVPVLLRPPGQKQVHQPQRPVRRRRLYPQGHHGITILLKVPPMLNQLVKCGFSQATGLDVKELPGEEEACPPSTTHLGAKGRRFSISPPAGNNLSSSGHGGSQTWVLDNL